jgi:hypothetical protein
MCRAAATARSADTIVGAELYRDLKTKRFSLLVSCQFNPDDARQILAVDRLTPVYRHEGA